MSKRSLRWSDIFDVIVFTILAGFVAAWITEAHAQPPTGKATLTCTAPTTNTDGTPITGAIAYRFYHGASPTTLTDVSTGQTSCAYVWTALAPGTHYFAATATVGGMESAFSNIVNKVILPPTPQAPATLTVN